MVPSIEVNSLSYSQSYPHQLHQVAQVLPANGFLVRGHRQLHRQAAPLDTWTQTLATFIAGLTMLGFKDTNMKDKLTRFLIAFAVLVVVLTCMAQVYRLVLDPNQFSPSQVTGGTNSSIKAGALVTNLYYNNGGLGSPSIAAAAHTNLGVYFGGNSASLSAANTGSDYGQVQASTNSITLSVQKTTAGISALQSVNGTNWLLSVNDVTDPQVRYTHDLSGFGIDDGTNLKYQINTNGAMTFQVITPAFASGTTNILIDFSFDTQSITTTTNMCVFQSTNRPTSTGFSKASSLRIFANGANVVVNTNSALSPGWRTASAQTLPVTITNGDWGLFTFIAYGPSETNVAFSYNYVH